MQRKVNIKNKRARFEYELIDQYTAGIVLTGTEIKSIRSSKASISESFCDFNDLGELFVINMSIETYKGGKQYDIEVYDMACEKSSHHSIVCH